MENISKERRFEGRRERNIQNFVSRRLKRGKYKVGQTGGGEEERRIAKVRISFVSNTQGIRSFPVSRIRVKIIKPCGGKSRGRAR